jgi:L-asparaginase II
MNESAPNPILCCTTRSGLVEMTHRGVFCCVKALPDRNHEVLFSAGNLEQLFYPRSSMKFIQVLPVIETGTAEHFGFTDTEISVMCASHNAEPEHLATVRSILTKAVRSLQTSHSIIYLIQ